MKEYKWLPLSTIKKYEPEMKRLRVSEVARSPRGFLSAYKRIGPAIKRGIWTKRRDAFIRRHLVQYRQNKTYRRWLALVAWAYMPDNKFA